MDKLKSKVDDIFPFSILLIIFATVTLGIAIFLIYAVLGRFSLASVIVFLFWAAIACIILRPLYIRLRIFHLYKKDIHRLINYLKYINTKSIKGAISEESNKFIIIKKVEELIADLEFENSNFKEKFDV